MAFRNTCRLRRRPVLESLETRNLFSATLPSDLNGDGAVNTTDFNILAAAFQNSAAGDINGDGVTDSIDFNQLAADFGKTAPVDSGPSDGTFEYTLSAGQSLSSIAAKPGDDVLLTGNWSKISIPWSGSSSAPIHVWFDASSTVGNGQSGTVFSGGTYLDIHGLHVTGVSNGLQIASAAAKIGTGTTLVDSLIENTTGTGLGIQGNNITVRSTTMQHNGQQGFVIQGSDTVLITDCKILYNNNGEIDPPWKNFTISGYTAVQQINGLYYVDPNWEAGGDKVWQSHNITLANNEAAYNVGPGLWTDYQNSAITMSGNYVHNNRGLDTSRNYQGEGIRLELSKDVGGFNITNNRIEHNTGAGVTLTSVRDVQITGNSFVSNSYGVLLRNDDSRGGLTNITVSGNTYSGNPVYGVWGSKFPLSNIVIEGTTL